MALQYSPKIVTDNLVMCLDPSQNKSYPTTDLPVKDQLNLWLDSADDTVFSYSSGTTVSQWRDKSGQNNHAVVGGGSPLRSVAINSRTAVSFTSNSWFRCTTGSFTSTATHFVVCRATSSSTTYQRVYNGGANTDYYVFIGGLTNNIATFWGNGSSWNDVTANSPSTTILNTLRIISAINTGTSATPYYDGTAMTAKVTNPASYTGYELNSYGGGYTGQPLVGEVCEIIVYNKQLSATELKQVHTYLGQKWGILNADRSIIDLSGFNDNGLLGNGSTSNMPLFDYYNKGAFKFYASNKYIKLGTSTTINQFAGDFAISLWAMATAENSNWGNLIGDWYTSGTTTLNEWQIMMNNSSTMLSVYRWNTGSIFYVASGFSANTWINVVLSRVGSTLTLYANNTVVGTTTNSSVFGSTTGNVNIGIDGDSSSERFTGLISNVLIYQKGLSATEVAQNYEAQKSKFTNTIVQQGLVLNLDAGNPYSYAGAGSDWFDVSGNNNTSLLVGTTLPTFSNTNGGILIYDGGTQYSRTPSPSNNFAWTPSGVGLNNMTIDLWIKTTDGSGTILSKPWSGNGEYNFGLGHQGFSIVIGNQTNTLGFSSILTGNWINLMIVVSPTQYGAYINGVQNTALTNHGITNNTPTYGNGQIELTLMTLYPYGGGGNAGFSTQGNIGSFRIYNRVLSAAEVLQNYNATKGRFGL